MAAAPIGGQSSRAWKTYSATSPLLGSDQTSSSSSWPRATDARPVSCDGRADEEDVLDLDSPWVSAADAASRLEEAAMAADAAGFHLRAEEEAEADEIRDNQQRQEDELMALEAIYGHDLSEFENRGGLRYFQIYIRYDLQDGAEVCAKLYPDHDNIKDGECPDDSIQEYDDGPDKFSYNCSFEHLPPLILTCLLPQSYPSKDPPYFTVTVKWMDEYNVAKLCGMLDTIWAELPGQEVVYQWVEWIRSSLSYLWSDGKIMLGLNIPMEDNRAIARSYPLEFVIPSMISYSSKKHHQTFLEDLHVCTICHNQAKGKDFIKLSCQHFFCVKCMETLCRMHVKEGSLFQLVCPETKCNASIPPFLLKNLLSEEEFERWDRLALKKALDSMSDLFYCPKCEMGCLQDEDNNAQCPKCFFNFCSFCKDPCHPGKQCLTPEQKFHQRQMSGKISAREMVEEMLSIRMLYGDARSCPNCRMTISKSEGCNKVVCTSCGQAFCFRCGETIVSGYTHFDDCELYEAREKDTTDWLKRMEDLETGNRLRAERHPVGSTVKCPKCHLKIYKGDDKYIFCWACQATYCTLCRKRVEFTRLQTEHWGSSQCVGIDPHF